MAFAYDIHKEYPYQESIFGQLDTTLSLTKLVNWRRVQTQNTSYDWSQEQARRQEPASPLHPTRNAMREWIDLAFGIDIAA